MSPIDQLRGGVVISCQPLPDEPDDPMRDPYVQARVAASAVLGGAAGLRINGADDIRAVGELCDVPVIGLIKHGPGPVAITPTAEHAVAAAAAGAAIVAVDATARPRPDGQEFADTVRTVHETTSALVLADVSTFDEGVAAVDAGADAVATTLAGYTADTTGRDGPDLDLLAALVARVPVPVIAEGRYRTSDDVTRALDAGAHAVVVGNAITSPLWLTRRLIGGVTPGLA
ncbi:N-acylglucosamine-6-phosphate 2-epimerase [Haloactinopolyspora alba]|uniref:N-acylglucosamine-6-phosphate 2-epimerase n=1 Tax=Haloactinopolyspora alba TaxID=648780 RepID=A0A2P8DT75_9ACTN|nr:putative N-acetylmannosamine-6-phosphate 2-epimerase [Haloactinopolyspora alba]PSL00411.1 N-acylglucosamine-6-phosphate 2-epimerase [Haloactinopolyspora alba]